MEIEKTNRRLTLEKPTEKTKKSWGSRFPELEPHWNIACGRLPRLVSVDLSLCVAPGEKRRALKGQGETRFSLSIQQLSKKFRKRGAFDRGK